MKKMSRKDYSDSAIIADGIFDRLIEYGIAKENVHYERDGSVTVWNDKLHNMIMNTAEEIAELCNSNQ